MIGLACYMNAMGLLRVMRLQGKINKLCTSTKGLSVSRWDPAPILPDGR